MKFKKNIAALLSILALSTCISTSFADTKIDANGTKTGIVSVEQDKEGTERSWNFHWKVKGTGVRMRRDASSSSEIMLVLPNRASVFTQNTTGNLKNGFRNVKYTSGGKVYYGWVSSSYLEQSWGR